MRGERDDGAAIGVVCALAAELGVLRSGATRTRALGIELGELDVDGVRVVTCVAGVGKVHAASGASALVAAGATRALLVVGTCGGLRQSLAPGTLVHCTTAVEVDFARGRAAPSDAAAPLRAVWERVAPGASGWFLTADRPVLSLWRRLRLARAFAGPCVADMETAAVARVAQRAGVPWAGLRAVTDRATWAGAFSFHQHFPAQAGRAADSVPALVRALARST